MRDLIVVIAACASVTGCGILEADSRRVIGLISADPVTATIQAPDTVRLGVTFNATVNSFGSSSCTSPDGVELTLGPAEARVIPYDRILVGKDVACTPDMAPIPHPVALKFTEAGAATIVADGMVHEAAGQRVRGTATKTIVVLP